MELDLCKYTEFDTIKNIWQNVSFDKEGLHEFLHNVVMNMNMFDENNHSGFGIMLPYFSDIYVLVSKNDFPFHLLKENNKNSITINTSHKNYVLGYIWLSTKYNNNHFISFIDSRISGLNIASFMINQYESLYHCFLLPHEIMLGAGAYWQKYFKSKYNIVSKKDLLIFINENHLDECNIKWNLLLTEYEMLEFNCNTKN